MATRSIKLKGIKNNAGFMQNFSRCVMSYCCAMFAVNVSIQHVIESVVDSSSTNMFLLTAGKIICYYAESILWDAAYCRKKLKGTLNRMCDGISIYVKFVICNTSSFSPTSLCEKHSDYKFFSCWTVRISPRYGVPYRLTTLFSRKRVATTFTVSCDLKRKGF
jgi:hypothetical protein